MFSLQVHFAAARREHTFEAFFATYHTNIAYGRLYLVCLGETKAL